MSADPIDIAIYARLMGFQGLTALVYNRIYKIEVPEDLPVIAGGNAVVFQRISETAGTCIDGSVTETTARYQFSAYSVNSSADARSISKQLSAAMQGYRVAPIRACESTAGGGMDLYDPDTRIHHIPIDFFVTY